MSSDDIEFESSTGEVMQDNTDETIINDEQPTSTSQQALKQLNQLTANNSNIIISKTTTATVASTSTVTASNPQSPKVAPIAKIVYIKNPNGTQHQIRIGGSLIGGNQVAGANSSNSNSTASTTGLQKVQLLQLKNKNVVSASVPTAANRFVLKSGNASQKIIISPSGAQTKIGAGPSGTNTRTITVSQAQQMGLIVPSNKTNASSAGGSGSTSTKTLILPPSSAGTTNLASKNQPTILNKGVKPMQSSKILIQSDSSVDSDAKSKPSTTTSIVKVAGTNQQVRVVSQGGKGLQYVRVLNAIPSGSANSTTAKIVNGRQQPVIVQRKIVPQQGAQIGASGKPQQFVTKKLEVMPIGSNTKVIKKDPITQTAKTPTTYLLNNVQKNIVTSSIDIKPVISNQSDSFEITEVKDEALSSSNATKKFASRTYSLSTDRKSKSPEPNQSSLMYSTLKLPSPEPIEGKFYSK